MKIVGLDFGYAQEGRHCCICSRLGPFWVEVNGKRYVGCEDHAWDRLGDHIRMHLVFA